MLIPIPSRSRPGLVHQVWYDPATGRASCPCEAFTFSKDRPKRCAHSESVKLMYPRHSQAS